MNFLRLLPPVEPGQQWFEIRPAMPARNILIALLFIASLFLALHLTTQYLLYFAKIDSSLFRLTANALDLNNESTVATWYSSVALLGCGLALALVGLAGHQSHSRQANHWFALSLLAVLFSADEVAQLHEKLNGPVRMLVDMGSFFAIAWVLPGVAFLVFLLVSFRRFYRSLPGRTRFYFALGAGAFFLGCLGVEMLGGQYSDAYGRENFGYKLLAGIEEFLEMAGVAIFIYGIVGHLNDHVSWKVQRLESGKTAAPRRLDSPAPAPSIATHSGSRNE